MPDLTLDEQKAISSLRRVAKKWPDTLWCFTGGSANTLTILKKNAEGQRVMIGDGAIDQEYIVDSVSGIGVEGGGLVMSDPFDSPAGQTRRLSAEMRKLGKTFIDGEFDEFNECAGILSFALHDLDVADAECKQKAGKIAELESGIANELEDIRLEVQARDAQIARLEAATIELQQSLSETQQLCVELEQERDQWQQACVGYKSDAELLRREYDQTHAVDKKA